MDDQEESLLGGQPTSQFFQAPPMERLRTLQTMQAGERSTEEDALMSLLQKRPDVQKSLMPDMKSRGTPESWNPFTILAQALGG